MVTEPPKNKLEKYKPKYESGEYGEVIAIRLRGRTLKKLKERAETMPLGIFCKKILTIYAAGKP